MRGLLMIEPLYHKTVAGEKTQTRRSSGLNEVNGLKATKTKAAIITNPDNWEETGCTMIKTQFGVGLESVDFCDYKDTQRNISCNPHYHVGEVLFLKEPTGQGLRPDGFETIYKFDNTGEYPYNGWSNKLFMPESDAREYIRITRIKCERLLDISDADCIAEGIAGVFTFDGISVPFKQTGWRNYMYKKTGDKTELSIRDSFISLFKFANKMKPAAEVSNIWVWAYSFEHLPDHKLTNTIK